MKFKKIIGSWFILSVSLAVCTAATTQPAATTRPTAAAAGAEVDAQLASAREQLTAQGTDLRAALARIAALEARSVPRSSSDIDPRDFGARGDGTHDDGPSIQAAIDSLVAMNGKGIPNSGKVTYQAYPNGGTVRLTPGVYKVSKPVKLWGVVTLAGHGTDTVINADGDAIDLAGVEIAGPGGGWYCVKPGLRDLTINAGGRIAASSTGGYFSPQFRRLNVCSAGWGVWLPDAPGGGCYCQDAVFVDIRQSNPGAGGILIRGNQNYIARYSIVDGTHPKGFKSPWENGKLGMIDVGGNSNSVLNWHVEFNVGSRKDGSPNAEVVCFIPRGNGVNPGTCTTRDGWPEVWPAAASSRVGSVIVDNCEVWGNLNESLGANVKYVNNGSHKN